MCKHLNWKLTWKADWFAQPARQNWIASIDFCFYLPGKVFASQTCGVDKTWTSQNVLSIGWDISMISWLEGALQRSDYDWNIVTLVGSVGSSKRQKGLVLWAEVKPGTHSQWSLPQHSAEPWLLVITCEITLCVCILATDKRETVQPSLNLHLGGLNESQVPHVCCRLGTHGLLLWRFPECQVGCAQ